MKKILSSILVVMSLSGCVYVNDVIEDINDIVNDTAEKRDILYYERQQSFFLKETAANFFNNLGEIKPEQRDLIIEEAKLQIARKGHSDMFSKALALEYLDLAYYEFYGMGDKVDGLYFLKKAKDAFDGKYPLAESLDDWRVPRKNFEALKWSREDLLNMVYDYGLKKDPINMAKAQASFDCWIEQQAEGFQELEIRLCKKEFKERITKSFNVLNDNLTKYMINSMVEEFKIDDNAKFFDHSALEDQYKEKNTYASTLVGQVNVDKLKDFKVISVDGKNINKNVEILESIGESDIKVAKIGNTQYNVYFDWNFTKVKPGDREKVKRVAADFKDGKYQMLIIQAFTDTSGPNIVNQRISEIRGQTVKNMLVAEGIPEVLITSIAFGETSTPGPDETKNAQYRRVEIVFE